MNTYSVKMPLRKLACHWLKVLSNMTFLANECSHSYSVERYEDYILVFGNLPHGIYPLLGKLQVTFLSYFQMISHSLLALLDFLRWVHYPPPMRIKIWLHAVLQVQWLKLQAKGIRGWCICLKIFCLNISLRNRE
jgi:hypothetical protein